MAIKKKIILSRITNGCIMSNFDNSENPIIHIRFDMLNVNRQKCPGQFMSNFFFVAVVQIVFQFLNCS